MLGYELNLIPSIGSPAYSKCLLSVFKSSAESKLFKRLNAMTRFEYAAYCMRPLLK